MVFSKTFFRLLAVVVVFVGFAGYNSMQAAWTAAPLNPPNSNTEAPLNVSSTTQAKGGDLGAIRMRAGQYCNAAGTVCSSDIGGSGTSTSGSSEVLKTIINSCEICTGWSSTGHPAVYRDIPNNFTCKPFNGGWSKAIFGDKEGGGDPIFTKIQCYEGGLPGFTYKWEISGWGYCAAPSCSTAGTQTRGVVCKRSDGSSAPDSMCPMPKPISAQSCVANRQGHDC